MLGRPNEIEELKRHGTDHDRIIVLMAHVESLEQTVEEQQKEIESLKRVINRGLGGMSVILGGSALIGWLSSHLDFTRVFK